MKWPAVEEHEHNQPVPDEEVFIHLVREHALIASAQASDKQMQKTHDSDHQDWKKYHP